MQPNDEPAAELLVHDEGASATAWSEARRRLEREETYWLATLHPDGRPHVRPLMAVWLDGALFVSSSEHAQKGRNLEHNAHCAVTVTSLELPALDLVLEGTAARVRDEATLERVAGAYGSKYGWQVDVRDGAFNGEGAPTAGPPPYAVFEITPRLVYGFPGMRDTDERGQSQAGWFAPTRWRF